MLSLQIEREREQIHVILEIFLGYAKPQYICLHVKLSWLVAFHHVNLHRTVYIMCFLI